MRPINNYEFSVEELGAGEKIVFIHGSQSDKRTWSNCMKNLSDTFHTISYSRRFHWPNTKISSEQDYSMAQHVEDLKLLIQKYSNSPINLVGHSYGALLCLELACQNPEMINKMVLIEPPAIRLYVSNQPKPSELIKLLFKRPKTALYIVKLGATGLGPATEAAKKGEKEKALELIGKAVIGKETFGRMTSERKNMALENLIVSELTGSGFLPIVNSKLKQMQIPTLFLTGENSPKVFSHLINRLEELIPNTRRIQIKRASHVIHEDNEDELRACSGITGIKN